MFSEERISVMFGNIEEIYDFSNRFLESLESAFQEDHPHLSELGQCFLDHVSVKVRHNRIKINWYASNIYNPVSTIEFQITQIP